MVKTTEGANANVSIAKIPSGEVIEKPIADLLKQFLQQISVGAIAHMGAGDKFFNLALLTSEAKLKHQLEDAKLSPPDFLGVKKLCLDAHLMWSIFINGHLSNSHGFTADGESFKKLNELLNGVEQFVFEFELPAAEQSDLARLKDSMKELHATRKQFVDKGLNLFPSSPPPSPHL